MQQQHGKEFEALARNLDSPQGLSEIQIKDQVQLIEREEAKAFAERQESQKKDKPPLEDGVTNRGMTTLIQFLAREPWLWNPITATLS